MNDMKTVIVLILLIAFACGTPPTAVEVAKKKENDSLQLVQAKFSADSILTSRLVHDLEEAESYISDFKLNDHKEMEAAHYLEVCLIIQKHALLAKSLEADETKDISIRAKNRSGRPIGQFFGAAWHQPSPCQCQPHHPLARGVRQKHEARWHWSDGLSRSGRKSGLAAGFIARHPPQPLVQCLATGPGPGSGFVCPARI